MSEHTLTVEKFVKAPPAQAYRAFTNSTALREWLCDVASVALHPGGRMYLYWNGDFYSSGEYLELEENRKVAFTWFGRGDQAATRVIVTLAEKDGGTQITLAHTVQDEKLVAGFQSEWATSLDNLAAVLDTGLDMRIFSRPLMGISLGDFTPAQAENLGVPVTQGLRLDGVIEGFGAHAAGLQANDVLVSLGGTPLTSDFSTYQTAMQGKKGGDQVEVVFYRGAEKKNITMELSRRPVPDIPFDAPELARQVNAARETSLANLAKAFEGASEEEAGFHPGAEEWSAKETVAHLIHTERAVLQGIVEAISGFESTTDGFGGNVLAAVRATVTAFPTSAALLDEMNRLSAEQIALIENFPAEFVARKGTYFRLAQGLLFGPAHIDNHIGQIQAAIAAARSR